MPHFYNAASSMTLFTLWHHGFLPRLWRSGLTSVEKLASLLLHLEKWELHTKGQGGFSSQSTATGLRVTVSSVLFLLKHLTEKAELPPDKYDKPSTCRASYWTSTSILWVQHAPDATTVHCHSKLPRIKTTWPVYSQEEIANQEFCTFSWDQMLASSSPAQKQ